MSSTKKRQIIRIHHTRLFAFLSELAELCDVLTVEIEHVNCDILATLEDRGVRVHPSPNTIRVVQDKYKQKEHFKEVQCVRELVIETEYNLGMLFVLFFYL